MLQRRASPSRKQLAQIASIAAPTGGLNARDGYAQMPPADAPVMENWFPMPSYVMPRQGTQIWATGLPGPVRTLACYSPPSGNRVLFAASAGSIYDVTSQQAVGAPSVTGMTTDWWQAVNFGAGGGEYLVMVNGQDPLLTFNGSGWEQVGNGTGAVISSGTASGTTATIATTTPHGLATGDTVTVIGTTPSAYNVSGASITVTGPSTFTYATASAPGGAMTTVGTYTYTPSITGIATTSLVTVNVFGGRLFFIEKNSMRAWYLPLNSVGGVANSLDFSSYTLLGGSLIAMATWTLETTSGSVELACFITSEGEIIMYQGNDPAYAASWYKVGSFRVGRPVGYRCTAKIGSDVAVLCADGLVPLSKAVLSDRQTRSISISDKIVNLINNDVLTYAGLPGWQVLLYPIGNKVIVNVPSQYGSYQYVMNTMNQSWSKFTGWSANCFGMMSDMLFYGDNGIVYRADVGNDDSGLPIKTKCVQAPNYFGNPQQKMFTLGRPVMTSDGPIHLAFDINADFDLIPPVAVTDFVTTSFTYWGAPWGSPWSAVQKVYKDWISTDGEGYCGSIALSMAVQGATVQWQATDVQFQLGGPL